MGPLGFHLTGINKKGIDRGCKSALVEDGREENYLNKKENLYQADSSKKMFFFFFISTSVIIGFCIFLLILQLMAYYTEENELNSIVDKNLTVFELLDAEKSHKQERLEILGKLDILQRNYKILQAQFEKAKETYLAKLHESQGV